MKRTQTDQSTASSSSAFDVLPTLDRRNDSSALGRSTGSNGGGSKAERPGHPSRSKSGNSLDLIDRLDISGLYGGGGAFRGLSHVSHYLASDSFGFDQGSSDTMDLTPLRRLLGTKGLELRSTRSTPLLSPSHHRNLPVNTAAMSHLERLRRSPRWMQRDSRTMGPMARHRATLAARGGMENTEEGTSVWDSRVRRRVAKDNN